MARMKTNREPRLRGRRVASLRHLAALLATVACLSGARSAFAGNQVLTASDDTFINAGNPNNNNGASLSFFTGTDGRNGVMRGLLRFGLPASLRGRVTITGVQLVMTIQALGDGTAGTAATESLQAVTQPWIQGNGFGNTVMAYTVGQACAGSIVGATWNQSNCAAGTTWSTPGGTVAPTVSGQADTTGVPIGGQVTWSSVANPGMIADVQSWIDDPSTNDGWRISSSTEGKGTQAQRFVSTESGASGPTLSIAYDCKPGFVASGNDCAAASTAPVAGAPATGLFAISLCVVAVVALTHRTGAGSRRRSPSTRRDAA
jgi:hypothetical protein